MEDTHNDSLHGDELRTSESTRGKNLDFESSLSPSTLGKTAGKADNQPSKDASIDGASKGAANSYNRDAGVDLVGPGTGEWARREEAEHKVNCCMVCLGRKYLFGVLNRAFSSWCSSSSGLMGR